MDIESQVTYTDAKNDECRNEAAVDGNTTAESSIPQGRGGPEDDCQRGGYGVNAGECLIDLKNPGDHDLPLMRGRRIVAEHALHN